MKLKSLSFSDGSNIKYLQIKKHELLDCPPFPSCISAPGMSWIKADQLKLLICSRVKTTEASSNSLITFALSSLGALLMGRFGVMSVCRGSNLWLSLRAVWVSPLTAAERRTDAGRSSQRRPSSTLRWPARGGRAASVSKATEGRCPHRRSPRRPGLEGRWPPEDGAATPVLWEEHHQITSTVSLVYFTDSFNKLYSHQYFN